MNHTVLPNIRHLDLNEIKAVVTEIGEKPFRAQQLYQWLWQKHAISFDEMSNLSKPFRETLATRFSLPSLTPNVIQTSADGTVKMRFLTFDNYFIESVLIPTEDRKTACISSQVGCSLSCKFCATGQMERKRNLFFDEIFDQAAFLNHYCQQHFQQKLTNIVFMGMGEPLLNYQQVVKAVSYITHVDGLAMSARRITVSTAGVAKMIKKLGDDKVRFKLALSLHAANDEKRNKIMPINETNHLQSLVDALNYFYAQTQNEITLEYILLHEFNHSPQDAEELVKLYRRIPADLVNLIEYNPVPNSPFSRATEENTQQFIHYLQNKGVNVRLRRSRGKDIDAACGQLANK